jgi:hypothetical protein
MIRRRVKMEIASRLASQVLQYNLKEKISHDEYLKIVTHNPVTKRDLSRDFNNRWERAVSMMLKYYPQAFKEAAKAHIPAPAPAPKAAPKPKAAPAKPAPAPKPKAAPKKES